MHASMHLSMQVDIWAALVLKLTYDACACLHACVCMLTCMGVHAYLHGCACLHAYMHACAKENAYKHAHAYMHAHAC
jgi:hypothetical protein